MTPPDAALLLPALGRARPPDALLRAVRGAGGALPRRAACGGALPEGIRPPRRGRARAAAAARRRRRRAASSATTRATRSSRRGRARASGCSRRSAPCGPAAVLVELFPFGRAKFARELVPLLEAARAAGALTACSLRDILVSRRADQQRTTTAPRASRTRTSTPCSSTAIPASRGWRRRSPRARRWACRSTTRASSCAIPSRAAAARGGQVRGLGRRRARRRAAAARGGRRAAPRPRADEADRRPAAARATRGSAARAARARASSCGAPCPTSARSSRAPRASVSQGGYNTALEVVRSGVPALVVPYATPEEDEQTRRARRLERLGARARARARAARALGARARDRGGCSRSRPAARARPRRRAPQRGAARGAAGASPRGGGA